MANSTALSLVSIFAAAVVAPLLAELLRRWRIPSVLFELILGMAIGPALLGWVEVDPFIGGLSELGLAVLFFLAGYEIDFAKLRGAPMNRATGGWVLSLVLGLVVATVLALEGVVLSGLLVGLALTTTAIGTLLPMLRDRGLLDTRFGLFITAAGAVGEFGPILAVTLLLTGSNPFTEAALLVVFALLAVAVAAMASRPQPPKLVEMLHRHLSTSTQLPVRIVILLVVALVVIAADLGLDNLLGAFAAGMITRQALSPVQSRALTPRLEAIGFGFLIPVFFIVSGVTFDLDALFGSTSTMLRVPMFLALLLVVRGVPALIVYRGLLTTRERSSLAFLQATALPLLVVIAEIGLSTDRMTSQNATALVGAGMLSVLAFPLIGFAILGRPRVDEPDDDRPGLRRSGGTGRRPRTTPR
ncbi:MAG: cation:proton antiporter [Microthrixaceae bacterium]